MAAKETRSTWDSVRSLFSLQTIPMLIAQGVVPKLIPVVTLCLGIALGLLWAYLIAPSVYTSAGAVNLSQERKEEYVRQVAYQFSVTNNDANAVRQLDDLGNANEVLTSVINKNTDPALTPILQRLQPLARANPSALSIITPDFLRGNLMPFLCVLVPLLVIGLAVIVNTIIPISLIFAPRSKERSTVNVGAEADRRKALEDARKKAEAMRREEAVVMEAEAPVVSGGVNAPAGGRPMAAPSLGGPGAPSLGTPVAKPVAVSLGTPVSQYLSSYVQGDDLYDDSFSIETASGEFLGEMGAGISKTIGVGDPKKVTAIEVWVFDKTDIKTVTKVLMSEHAFNDDAIRSELAPKGEAVLAKPGSLVQLETQALIIQARIIDQAYGSGALPGNSFFERLAVEISAYPKKNPTPAPRDDAFGDTTRMG